MIFFIHIW